MPSKSCALANSNDDSMKVLLCCRSATNAEKIQLVCGFSLNVHPPMDSSVLMAGFWLALYLVLERRSSLGKRLIRAVGFGVIVLVPTAFEPAVSYRTHLIGFVVGLVMAIAYFLRHKQRLRAAERVVYE